MAKELMRWEDSPNLEHHCPRCQTPLNNPRAKHTCYFKHVEVCPLFHQHFFLIGQSHNCVTCRNNHEAHEQRHRELALLLRQMREAQEDHGIEPRTPGTPVTPVDPDPADFREHLLLSPPTSPTRGLEAEKDRTRSIEDKDPKDLHKLKKSERKKAKKRFKALKGGDALTSAEIETVTLALHPINRKDSAFSITSTDSSNTSEDESKDSEVPDNNITCLINHHKAFAPNTTGKLNSFRVALQNELLSALSPSESGLKEEIETACVALKVPAINAKTPKMVADAIHRVREAVEKDISAEQCETRIFRIRQAAWYRFANRSVLSLGEK